MGGVTITLDPVAVIFFIVIAGLVIVLAFAAFLRFLFGRRKNPIDNIPNGDEEKK